MTVEELQIIISAKTEKVQAKIDSLKAKIAGVVPQRTPDVDVSTNKAQENMKKLQAEVAHTQAKIKELVASRQKLTSDAYVQYANGKGLVGSDPKMQEIKTKIGLVNDQIAPLKSHLADAQAQLASFGDSAKPVAALGESMNTAGTEMSPLRARLAEIKARFTAAGDAAQPAALKTRLLGESMGFAGNRMQGAGRSSGYFGRMVKSMLLSMVLYKGVAFITQSVSEGMQNMALGNAQANGTMSQLATSALYLKNSMAAALMPALQAITPVINQIADALANAFNMFAMLTARIFNHASTVTIAKRANVDYAKTLGGVSKAAKEAKSSLASFDQINTLSRTKSAGSPGMPDPKQMFEQVKIPQWVNNIGAVTDQIGKVISDWWGGLTSDQKWGAGLGGTAGVVIGGIIGRLIGGPIGQVVGAALGGAAGVAIGVWWQSLTSDEKWGAGIGAGAGALIGGIIGGIILGPIGIVLGAGLGGVGGALIGKWWTDLTTDEKWSVGPGAGAGALAGGIIGGIFFGPLGALLGVGIGGVAGGLIGKWWSTLSSDQKWDVGNGVGAIAGAIIGGIFFGPLGAVLGAGIGALVTNLIRKFWDGMTDTSKWRVGSIGVGAIIGGIIGTIIGGPLGAVIGAALGGAAGYGVSRLIGHANGTSYHPGGPALVNDAPGFPFREFVQFPDGRSFIPQGRNVIIPNLPAGSKVVPAQQTKALFPHYASGLGDLSVPNFGAALESSVSITSARPERSQGSTDGGGDFNFTFPIYLDRNGTLIDTIIKHYTRQTRTDG